MEFQMGDVVTVDFGNSAGKCDGGISRHLDVDYSRELNPDPDRDRITLEEAIAMGRPQLAGFTPSHELEAYFK
jgi:hypothetical protein